MFNNIEKNQCKIALDKKKQTKESSISWPIGLDEWN